MNIAGVILCGGRSQRMGTPKATLPFGDETLLERVTRLLATVAQPIVVVAAPGQAVVNLPGEVRVVYDQREGRGPLEGIRAGLAAAADASPIAYVTSCDAPLLVPAFVERMAQLLGDYDVAVPRIDEQYHPLSAVYRTNIVSHVDALLEADRLRLIYLYERVATRIVTADELREVDPTLATLRNLNHPEEYQAVLAELGFAAPAGDIKTRGQ